MSAPPATLAPSALAEIVTAVWRLCRKLEAGPEMPTGVGHHQRALLDALTESGIETGAYEGMPFDPGLRVRVVAYQPMPGLDQEQVVETLRPTVYLHGTVIALGEVIVGTPVEGETAP